TNGLRAAAAAGMVVIASPNREYPPEPDALALAALVVESLDEVTRKPNALIWLIAAKRSAAQKAGHRDCIGGRNARLCWLEKRRPSPLRCATSRGGGGGRGWQNGWALAPVP